MLIFILNTRDIMPDDSTIIDDGAVGKAAKDIKTDITEFNANLSSSDTTVQAALESLDNLSIGGGEANPDVVVQSEAETGTATTERIWTAERVKQAIAALGGGGGGGVTTRVGVTTVGNITSTVTADTIYVWNDSDASQDFELTLPSASSAGAGTQITVISVNMDHGNTLKVFPAGSDVIYDDYEEANVGPGGNTTGFATFYAYFPMTLISDGDGFWITRAESSSGYWVGIS